MGVPFDIRYRYEKRGCRDGLLLSWFVANTAKPGSPGYEP